MAISTTTTSDLNSLVGAVGEMLLNTDTNQLVIFHSAGVGNYSAFSNDGTLGASIQLTFNDNSAGPETIYGGSISQWFPLVASDLSGYYKRYNSATDAITDIGNETNMSGSTWATTVIPGGDQQGFTYSAPYMYQANGANSSMVANYNAPVVFVYTGSVKGGGVQSKTVIANDGISTYTWYYVPILYLVNDGNQSGGPFWGLTMAICDNSSIKFPYDGSNSNGNAEFGILQWGSGYVDVGNNEATLRQSLSLSSFNISTTSSFASGAVNNWSLDQVYTP